jgi:hypothetical protein
VQVEDMESAARIIAGFAQRLESGTSFAR